MIEPVLPEVAITWEVGKRITPFRGKPAAHSMITKSSRRYWRGARLAFERAMQQLFLEYIEAVEADDDALCHLILVVQTGGHQ